MRPVFGKIDYGGYCAVKESYVLLPRGLKWVADLGLILSTLASMLLVLIMPISLMVSLVISNIPLKKFLMGEWLSKPIAKPVMFVDARKGIMLICNPYGVASMVTSRIDMVIVLSITLIIVLVFAFFSFRPVAAFFGDENV